MRRVGHLSRLPWIAAAVAVTILLGPSAVRASIQFENATYSVSEGAGTLQVRLTRTGDLNQPQFFTVGLNGGTALNVFDFGFLPLYDQPWPAGQASVDLTITIVNDIRDESDETIILYLATGDGFSTATVTIVDNDGDPPPTTPTPPTPQLTPFIDCASCVVAVISKACHDLSPTPVPAPVVGKLERWVAIPQLAVSAQSIDFGVYDRLRLENLARSPGGRFFTEFYDTHTREMIEIVLANPQAFETVQRALESWQPGFGALVEGRGNTTFVSTSQVADLQAAFDAFESLGSTELRLAFERQEAALGLPGYAGLTLDQARERLEAAVLPGVTLPIATSVHGVGGSFFHSDVRVLNPSRTAPVTVTARYRCATGACGVSERTFDLAPGELRVFTDIVTAFFGAPETFGAIEFVGEVFVDSRIYTPSRPAPTTGMYVPGQTFDEAVPESVLTTLSHSTSLSLGFRTNVGAYNPNDVPLTVTFSLKDAKGDPLGQVTRSVPARTVVQVNNVFGAAGVGRDVESAYAVVRADGVHELFAYAAIIDNQTQDPFFIRGRNNRGGYPPSVTLPAVASVHGVGGSFFHSDVRVFNPSLVNSVTATARYRCPFASCGASEQTFTLAPREMRSFDDIVVSLFGAPETFGAIEFSGKEFFGGVFVDSRLYTPSRPGPTNGMAVPGLRPERAYPESYLPSLSHSVDPSRGFRTNAGVYNGNDVPLTVTFTLYDAAGSEIGRVTRSVPARTPVQVSNVFGAAGIATDVESAYAVVRADGIHELFAYAAVVDNQSQDPTFTIGRGTTPSLTQASRIGRPAAAAVTTPTRRLSGFLLLSSLAVLALASARAARRGRMRRPIDATALEDQSRPTA